tara:strand:- start:90 stop:377 length:288 start_codon:yes stop_codon:yes gene_type:complete
MPRAKKIKVKSVEEKKEAGETLSFSDPLQHRHEDTIVHSHEGGDVEHSHEPEPASEPESQSGPMSKEEWCEANGITRPGSNHAQTEYDKYIVSLA